MRSRGLWRASVALLRQWRAEGPDNTVREQMNVAYIVAHVVRWAFGASGKARPA